MIGKKKPDNQEQIDARVPLEEIDQDALDEIVGERDRLRAEQDRILRAAADAQNRLRTARKDVQESRLQGVTTVARDVISALDSFDLALSQSTGNATVDSIILGVRSIRDELIRALSNHGVRLIEATPGQELDPQRHQAMMEKPSDEFDSGHVVAMVQVGYMLNDRVIRPAKVIVAARRTDPATDGESDGGGDEVVAERDPGDSTAETRVDDEGASEAGDPSAGAPITDPGDGTPDTQGVYHIGDEDLDGEGLGGLGDEPDDGPPEAPREDGHADV